SRQAAGREGTWPRRAGELETCESRLDGFCELLQIPRDNECCEALGRNQLITARDQFGHFVPIHCTYIQPERHPASWSDVSRQVKPVRLGGGQRYIVARQHLAGDRNDAIAVVVVQEICEDLLPDHEACVSSANLTGGLWKRKADL